MIMMADLDNMNFPKLCAIFSRVNLGGHKIEKMCTLSYESGFWNYWGDGNLKPNERCKLIKKLEGWWSHLQPNPFLTEE